jgi:hypothetical protein
MRAIIVELAGGGAAVVEGSAHAGDSADPASRATGSLAERQRTREEYDSSEGEPW